MAKKRQRSRGQGTLFKRVPDGPWIASWFDHNGKRLERSTHTTDKQAAGRILSKRVTDAAIRRDGVVDARVDGFLAENRKPLPQHINDYIDHCVHVGHAKKHIKEKRRHLDRILTGTGAARLSDLTADALERHLAVMKSDGLSSRTVNFARQVAVAFMSWCVDRRKIETNVLSVVPKMDESQDRRRIRRPLTDDELNRLLAVAEDRDRKDWYLFAVLAGLRRGDMIRLIWSDIDFNARTVTIRQGKAKRDDVLPLHPQLYEALLKRREKTTSLLTAKVFSRPVHNDTRLKDFLRADIAYREVVMDKDGKPVMIGKGKRRRPKTRIVTEDAEGRVVDLHALRTTLGTNLARAGVAPQIAQKIMRHSDYKTTLKHYTVLSLSDTATAINKLPSITSKPESQTAEA